MKTLKFIFMFLAVVFYACQKDGGYPDEQKVESDFSPRNAWLIKTIDSPLTKAVADTTKFWPKGATIRIKFLNGTEELQNLVKKYAAIWLEYAYLKFEYVEASEEADVKIGFDMENKSLSWSTIGTDCKDIPQDQPSLNFFNLSKNTENVIKSEILRGFGHVLGLGFEHQNPNSPLVFNETFVKMVYNLSDQETQEFIKFMEELYYQRK